jgi:hypothetical protein
MATTPTTRVTALARSHRLDVDIATYPAVNYQQVLGVDDLKLVEEIRVEDDEPYDSLGAARETNTGYSWRLEGKLAFSTNLAGTALDSVHSFLRAQFKKHRAQRVEQAEFGVRFYQRDGLDDLHNHEGRVYVKSWGMPGGRGRDTIDIVLQGQDALADITNPNGSLVPVIFSLSPTGGSTAGGDLVNIYGTHFAGVTGAAAVKFGATNATNYVLVNDGHIVATAPAGGPGTVQVSVTTPSGTSADTAADDYTYA